MGTFGTRWIRTFRLGRVLPVLIVCTICGGASGYLIGRSVALGLSRQRLAKNSEHAIEMTDSYVVALTGVMADLRHSPHPRCSAADVEYMRNVVLHASFISDAGWMSGDRIACSALLGREGYASLAPSLDAVEMHSLRVYRHLEPYSKENDSEDGTAFALRSGGVFVVRDPLVDRYMRKGNYPFLITVYNSASRHWERLSGKAPMLPDVALSRTGVGQSRDLVYATSCSSRFAECAVSYASIPAELTTMRSVVFGTAAAGALIGTLWGLIVSLLILRRQGLEQQLRRAIARDRLHMVYQPIIDLATRRIAGAEALVRWTGQDKVAISPELFVPLAEQHGFTEDLTRWVVRHALDEFAPTLRAQPDFRLSLNVAAADLTDENFLPVLKEQTQNAGVRPGSLAIEVTERSTAQGTRAAAGIQRLHEAGFGVHIDDFGTGYSSLSYLHDLAVDSIKLDRSFTRMIGTETIGQGIIPQILSMADTLHLEVIVEGVETELQARYFATYNQPILAQGWLFGHPVSAREFHRLLDEDKKTSSAPTRESPGTASGHIGFA